MEAAQNMPIYQMFVKKLDSTYVALRFNTPKISVETLTNQILNRLAIPQHHHKHLYFTYKGRSLSHQTEITCDDDKDHTFNDVVVCYRLCGGKGGFGSLLRGAATKAGQKKTNNFDACRDMSGRRLRHVNAEKKLEEWRLEEEGRKLEKSAEEFLKKNAKKAKGKVSGNSAEKYVEKYREVSAKCVAQVEVSVREAIGSGGLGGKRKSITEKNGLDAKRLKIWRGKKKMDDSDSDDSDNEGNEKSIVLIDGSNSDSSKEVEEGSSFVSCEKLDGETSDEGLCKSGCEEEIGVAVQECLDASTDNGDGTQMAEPAIHGAAEILTTETVTTENKEEVVGQAASISCEEREDSVTTRTEANGPTEVKSGTVEEKVNASTTPDEEMPLSFDEYSSAAEMEVLGMERLKSELQSRGLKCGGTLQERASRLFLLKTTPLEKLPKKLLAKK